MRVDSYQFNSILYRKALGHFATGVTVITTACEGSVHGMTANAFCSVSLDPPLVLVSVDKKNQTHTLLAQNGVYGVNVLTRQQENLSRHFSGKPQEGLEPSFRWCKDCPLLKEALAQFICRVVDAHDAGDHTLYIAQVEYIFYADEHAPLLFYGGAYQDIEGKALEAPLFMYDLSLW